jgi:hypothetical protein
MGEVDPLDDEREGNVGGDPARGRRRWRLRRWRLGFEKWGRGGRKTRGCRGSGGGGWIYLAEFFGGFFSGRRGEMSIGAVHRPVLMGFCFK